MAGVLIVLLTVPLGRVTNALARRSGWLGRPGGAHRSDGAMRRGPATPAAPAGGGRLLRVQQVRKTFSTHVVLDGVIELAGTDIADLRLDADAQRARMGMVFQQDNLFGHLRVIDNLTLAPRLVHKAPADQARADALAMLDRVGLADKARALPDELSGGQAQREAFAREVADEVCFLHAGRVHERGTPTQVLSDPQRERTQEFLRRITG